MSKEPF